MRQLLFLVLLSTSFVFAQNDKAARTSSDNSKDAKGQVTVQGCLSRANGDFILMEQDPGNTYELRGRGDVDLASHLGQKVEVVGERSTSTSTSTDTMSPGGSPSPVTITVSSITTIERECSTDHIK